MGICCLLLKNLASDCETWSWCKIDFLAKFHMTSCSSWEIVMKHHTSTPSHVLQGSVTVHPSINPSIYYCLYEFRLQGHQCNQRPVSNPHKTLKSYVSSCGWWAHRRTDLWSFFGLAFLPWASFQDGTPVTQIQPLQEGYNSFLHVFIK